MNLRIDAMKLRPRKGVGSGVNPHFSRLLRLRKGAENGVRINPRFLRLLRLSLNGVIRYLTTYDLMSQAVRRDLTATGTQCASSLVAPAR